MPGNILIHITRGCSQRKPLGFHEGPSCLQEGSLRMVSIRPCSDHSPTPGFRKLLCGPCSVPVHPARTLWCDPGSRGLFCLWWHSSTWRECDMKLSHVISTLMLFLLREAASQKLANTWTIKYSVRVHGLFPVWLMQADGLGSFVLTPSTDDWPIPSEQQNNTHYTCFSRYRSWCVTPC